MQAGGGKKNMGKKYEEVKFQLSGHGSLQD